MLSKSNKRQNKLAKIENLSTNERMLQGTAWLSMGLMLSKIIGALYIIPWARMIGDNFQTANSLYTLAYVPYVLFIDIGTAGFPLAITKQISQLNAKNEYKASMQLFKNSLIIMSGLGLLSAALFYFSADILTSMGGITPTQNTQDNIRVLQSLAPALIIIPPMSLLRGFFQGFQQMTTPAVSQIIDQFVRVAYMLAMTFFVINVQNGSFIDAVVQSTFAAFIGASASLLFLIVELVKERHYIFEKIKFSKPTKNISLKESFVLVLTDSLPFVLISTATSFLAIIDQMTYQHLMSDFSNFTQQQIAVSYAWFSANAPKLTSIVGSLTIAVTSAAIPTIARLFHQGNQKELAKATLNNLILYSFIVIPSSIGLFIVSNSIYRVFYVDANGAHVLKVTAINLIITGLFSMFIVTFQGMGKHHIAIKSLVILLLSKFAGNILLTALFKEQGPTLANLASALIASYYLIDELYKTTRFNKRILWQKMTDIIYCTILMSVTSSIVYLLLVYALPEFGALYNLLRIVITAIVGGLTYVVAALKLSIADDIMPSQAAKLRRILKLR